MKQDFTYTSVGKVQLLIWAERPGSMFVLPGRVARVVLLSFGNTCVAGLRLVREAAVSSSGSVMNWVVHGFTNESC